MRELVFNIDDMKLSKSGDFSNITKGSKGYLTCRLNIVDEKWNRMRLVAVFYANDDRIAVPVDEQKTFNVPDEVTDCKYFKMELRGYLNGVLAITNKVLISQEV